MSQPNLSISPVTQDNTPLVEINCNIQNKNLNLESDDKNKNQNSSKQSQIKKSISQINVSINQNTNNLNVNESIKNTTNQVIPFNINKKEINPTEVMSRRDQEKVRSKMMKDFTNQCTKVSAKIVKSCNLIEKFSDVIDNGIPYEIKNIEHILDQNDPLHGRTSKSTLNNLTLENFNKNDALDTMTRTYQQSTMQLTHCNLREEPNDYNKTYSNKFRQMNTDQGKLLEEDIRLKNFSLHQSIVDKQTHNTGSQSDRIHHEVQKSNEIINLSIKKNKNDQDFEVSSVNSEKLHQKLNYSPSRKDNIQSFNFKRAPSDDIPPLSDRYSTRSPDSIVEKLTDRDPRREPNISDSNNFSHNLHNTYVPMVFEKIKIGSDGMAQGYGNAQNRNNNLKDYNNHEVIYEQSSRPSTSIKTNTTQNRFFMNQSQATMYKFKNNTMRRTGSNLNFNPEMNNKDYNDQQNLRAQKESLYKDLTLNLLNNNIPVAKKITNQINSLKVNSVVNNIRDNQSDQFSNTDMNQTYSLNQSKSLHNKTQQNLLNKKDTQFTEDNGNLSQRSKSIGKIVLKNLNQDKVVTQMVERDINSSLQKTRDPIEFDQFNERITATENQQDRTNFVTCAINNFRNQNSLKLNEFRFEQEQMESKEKLTKQQSSHSTRNSRPSSRLHSSNSKITLVKRLKSNEVGNKFDLDGDVSPAHSPIKGKLKRMGNPNVVGFGKINFAN